MSKDPSPTRPRVRLTRRAALLLLRSAAAAALLTASTAVVALLSLMFSTGEAPSRSVGLFGSLYVTASETASGATDASMGVANPTALIVIFAFAFVSLLLTQVLHGALQQYRLDLIAARAGA